MVEAKTKGDLFHHVLMYIQNKRGRVGLEAMGYSSDNYRQEQWYPFQEFCDMLAEFFKQFGGNDSTAIYNLGRDMIRSDSRWQEIFHGKDPKDVFVSNTRQEGQYVGGDIEAMVVDEHHVQVILKNWSCTEIWYEFYRGRMRGVLELTGKRGKVTMTMLEADSERTTCRFDVTWV